MSLVSAPIATADSMGDLLDQLGGISPFRVRVRPAPGTATEADVIAIHAAENRLFELIDGALVEKGLGYRESVLALAIGSVLRSFVLPRRLGIVSGADGMVRLFPGMVRIPDVAFVSRERLPGGRMPTAPIPDLAIEVLSESNTALEMRRKRVDYFNAGVRLVWAFDLDLRVVDVYIKPDHPTRLKVDDVLEGADVLPGFAIRVSELFAALDP